MRSSPLNPSPVESLLSSKQWKFRSTTIRNVRLSCCVAGHIKVTEAAEDIQETMDIFVKNDLDLLSEEYALIKYNLLCGDSEMCTLPGCGHLYEMQTSETLARQENPNPKWPVPKDLIELQPSYKQDDWNPDWQSTSSCKAAYLVERLKALQEFNKEVNSSVDEDDEGKNIDKLCWPSQRSAMDVPLLLNCSRPGNESYKMLPEKVLIFSQFLEHIHVIEQQLTSADIKFVGMYSPMHSSNKMKSPTTFRYDDSCMALLMDGSAALGLDLSFVTHVFLMERIWDRISLQKIVDFAANAVLFPMSLTTREPVAGQACTDSVKRNLLPAAKAASACLVKCMEEQVISRAHRMGATRPIHVETLAMRVTIEEQMMKFLQDADACREILKEGSQRLGHEGSRPCRTLHDFAESNYLARLGFVHRNSYWYCRRVGDAPSSVQRHDDVCCDSSANMIEIG
ncbi:Detected protein of confused Function [Hibiscus syriacus]|uniref:Detected protein of confused Function n=1 Tax=Hibiscus syriacus TaxID=106335 RepID=A0A6A2WHL2_HIBSY|nr:Detected protein of confused Function [Hibiscus syriacus]